MNTYISNKTVQTVQHLEDLKNGNQECSYAQTLSHIYGEVPRFMEIYVSPTEFANSENSCFTDSLDEIELYFNKIMRVNHKNLTDFTAYLNKSLTEPAAFVMSFIYAKTGFRQYLESDEFNLVKVLSHVNKVLSSSEIPERDDVGNLLNLALCASLCEESAVDKLFKIATNKEALLAFNNAFSTFMLGKGSFARYSPNLLNSLKEKITSALPDTDEVDIITVYRTTLRICATISETLDVTYFEEKTEVKSWF